VLVTVSVSALGPAVATYSALLGHAPLATEAQTDQRRALFGFENAWLELSEQGEPSELSARLAGLAFGVEDLLTHDGALGSRETAFGFVRAPLTRGTRGLALSLFERSSDAANAEPSVLQRADDNASRAANLEPAALHALDHVVIRTADCQAALELFGQRLGLRLALDRMLGSVRMLFFRTVGVTIEVVHDSALGERDALYGLAYRTRDLPACHARLSTHLPVSTIRDGRKPGTQVLTVRDGTCGVPTLVLHDRARA
jgi:hypothetical protein